MQQTATVAASHVLLYLMQQCSFCWMSSYIDMYNVMLLNMQSWPPAVMERVL